MEGVLIYNIVLPNMWSLPVCNHKILITQSTTVSVPSLSQVAHAFLLGTKYSSVFNGLIFMDNEQKLVYSFVTAFNERHSPEHVI